LPNKKFSIKAFCTIAGNSLKALLGESEESDTQPKFQLYKHIKIIGASLFPHNPVSGIASG
jgi:hypothetical protein